MGLYLPTLLLTYLDGQLIIIKKTSGNVRKGSQISNLSRSRFCVVQTIFNASITILLLLAEVCF